MIDIKSYCFLFNDEKIIVRNNDDNIEFFLVEEVKKLGVDDSKIIYIGTYEENKYYTASIHNEEETGSYVAVDLNDIYDEISEKLFMLVFRAMNFTNWMETNKHCNCCGAKIHLEPDKTYMQCESCGHIVYPLLTPAIIVAVLKEDKILLARSPHFPPKFFSLISGHVDPGEYIEGTVVREVREETGIEIKNLKYLGSYSWPFPDKLMFAFIAEYDSGEIQIDNDEIVEAGWFSLDDLPETPSNKYSLAKKIINYVIKCNKDNNFNKPFMREESRV